MDKEFEILAKRQSDKIAVIDCINDIRLTYLELYNKVANIINVLKRLNFNKNNLTIGYVGKKGHNSIAAFLAIQLSGNTYLTLNIADPLERIQFIITDSECDLILTDSSYRKLNEIVNVEILNIDDIAIDTEVNLNYSNSSAPAFIVYTSGTTGQPKGSLISRESLKNLYREQIKVFEVTSVDGVLQFSSLSFDASISEMSMTIMSGAHAVFIPKETVLKSNSFSDAISNYQISVITAVPSFISSLEISIFLKIRKLILAGESPNLETVKSLSSKIDVYNAYGPSECTVCSTIHKFPDSPQEIVIGKPINGVDILITNSDDTIHDERGKNFIGEICIGGINVSLGYINRPNLNQSKFFEFKGTKYYKSGDRGYIDSNNNLVFLGRMDDQIKINGYRIEPREINNYILKYFAQISNCFTNLISDGDAKSLVLFVESKDNININHIENSLRVSTQPTPYELSGKFFYGILIESVG